MLYNEMKTSVKGFFKVLLIRYSIISSCCFKCNLVRIKIDIYRKLMSETEMRTLCEVQRWKKFLVSFRAPLLRKFFSSPYRNGRSSTARQFSIADVTISVFLLRLFLRYSLIDILKYWRVHTGRRIKLRSSSFYSERRSSAEITRRRLSLLNLVV